MGRASSEGVEKSVVIASETVNRTLSIKVIKIRKVSIDLRQRRIPTIGRFIERNESKVVIGVLEKVKHKCA